MQSYYLTDTGKVRNHNEDSVLIVKNDSGECLMAVADGMGGHRAGEVASSLAITHLGEEFVAKSSIGEKADAVNWIRDNVTVINEKIFKYTAEHPESQGMGTTLVVAILTKEFLLFGNIGDSSGFVVKKNKLYKVTKDHTLVNLLVNSGELTEAEAANHPRKNVLMRALGASEEVDADIFDVDMEATEILLASDGLTNLVTQEQISKILNSNLNIEEKVLKLIRKSNLHGGNDNISIAYLIRESGAENDN